MLHTVNVSLKVIQIKPQLEKLLKSRTGLLVKQWNLCQSVMELFLKYQIPSDLLSVTKEATLQDNVTTVKGMIEHAKKKELEEKEMEKLSKEFATLGKVECINEHITFMQFRKMCTMCKTDALVVQTCLDCNLSYCLSCSKKVTLLVERARRAREEQERRRKEAERRRKEEEERSVAEGDAQILCCAIAKKEEEVLVEHSMRAGNFSSVTRQIIRHVTFEDAKKSFFDKSGRYTIHIMTKSGILYLCFAPTGYKTSICFSFLQALRSNFESEYTIATVGKGDEKFDFFSLFV